MRPALVLALALEAFVPWRAAAASPATAGDPRPAAIGLHGMALVGTPGHLYASHMPMFHAPHDTQVILEVAVEDAGIDAALRSTLARADAPWSIEPERFDLHRLARGASAPLVRFRATVYRGHFERGGEPVYRDVTIRVRAVLLYRPLDPAAPNRAGTYLLVGPAGDRRLAYRLIGGRGDADHIVALTRCADRAVGGIVSAGDAAALDAAAFDTAVLDASTLEASLLAGVRKAGCTDARAATLYLETGDLE
ncbi:MAG: hypothetical protein ACTHOH_13240 [Lysobacteraceae bacterium]